MAGASPHALTLYGVRLESAWPIPALGAPLDDTGGLGAIRLVDAGPAAFDRVFEEAALVARAPGGEWWLHCAHLPDGGAYIRWADQFAFIVSPDGGAILGRTLATPAPAEAFQACLLGVALSFALIKRGIEPLHATAVAVDGGAVAFAGESGRGKSTLAAACMQAGARLLTDDLLVVTLDGQSCLVQPGPPRIKLVPELAKRLLGQQARGWALTEGYAKEVVPLDAEAACPEAVPLLGMFVLDEPSDEVTDVRIARLPGREAALALVESTFNIRLTDSARLQGHLDHVTRMALRVPVASLSYPRRLDRLPDVVEAVRAGLEGWRA